MKLRHLYSLLFLTALSLLLNGCAFEQKKICIPEKQDNVLVYDIAQILDENEESALNRELNTFKANTSNVIVVITHPDFCDEAPFMYATQAGESMGVGTAENDNGIVIVVGTEIREAFIAVGKGLEGAIPDAYAKRIIEQEMLPEFRNNNYPGGIRKSVTVLQQLASGEISEYAGGASTGSKKNKGFPWMLIVVFFLFGGASLFGQIYRVRKYAMLNDIAFWTAWSILANSRRSHGGSYSDFSGGRGPFGGGGFGGGGGGFGGFGGGSFGGGGAGGSW